MKVIWRAGSGNGNDVLAKSARPSWPPLRARGKTLQVNFKKVMLRSSEASKPSYFEQFRSFGVPQDDGVSGVFSRSPYFVRGSLGVRDADRRGAVLNAVEIHSEIPYPDSAYRSHDNRHTKV